MKNPFLILNTNTQSEYLSSKCSLNRAVMAKIPIKGIDDGIEGLDFLSIFSTKLIVEEIKKNAKLYDVDISNYQDAYLPKLLDRALESDNIKYRELANSIVKKFGNRLGMIFLALKLGEEENRDARDDWSDEEWEYWKNLDTVILVGGLASGLLGRKLKEQICYVFDIACVEPYNIRLFDNGTYVGVLGCASVLMKDNSTALAFDMGQTNMKRAVVNKGEKRIVELNSLDSKKSMYMQNNVKDEERLKLALKLHRRIVNVIKETYIEREKYDKLSNEIIVSIANYVNDGELNSVRGGYSKLSLLGDNYQKLLSNDLSSELHKEMSVKLVHDGTATALYFRDLKNSMCLSLGTVFGLGFPEINFK